MFMRRVAILLLLLLGCRSDSDKAPSSTRAPAPEPVPIPLPAPEPATNLPTPLLWVVGGPNGPSYLLGTMHLGVDVERHVHPIVLERLDASKLFVMETDVSDVDPFEMSMLAELPAGKSLDEMFTKAQWDGLSKIVPLPPDGIRRYRPWFILVVIAQSLLPSTQPMDAVLQRRAKSAGMQLEYLEDWKYQIDVLDEVIGAADLIDIVDNYDDTRQELVDLAAGYVAGDAAVIEKIMYDPEKYEKNPKVLDILIIRRNREWIPKLEGYLEKGDAFIAVGVGHLVGDRGVVAMLRKRGYKVARLTLPQAQERPAAPAAAAQ